MFLEDGRRGADAGPGDVRSGREEQGEQCSDDDAAHHRRGYRTPEDLTGDRDERQRRGRGGREDRPLRLRALLVGAVRALVESGVRAGEFEAGAVAAMPDVVASSHLHLSLWRLMFKERRPLDEAAFVEAHVELVMRALRPTPIAL